MRKTKRMLAVVIAVMMIFTAFPMTANAATKNVYNFNISNSKVTKNASDGKLPADANPVYVGGKYYFNLQVSNDIKLKIAELYIKYPGSNKFDKKHIENANNFMRYVYTSQSVGNKEGTLTYYWKVMNTSGKWKSQAKKTVKVVKKPVTSIALNKNSIKVGVGSTYKLTATVKPSDATYKNVSWSSKDSRVASVDKNGNVTAKKTGKTTVTATADGKSTSCTVEVAQVKVTQKNISTCSITIPNVTYTSKPLTPEPVVKDGSKVLKKGTDYTTQYSNNVNAGTGKVVITGKGNYTGSVTKTFKINKAKDSISFSLPVVAYSTKEQSPKFKVTSKWNLKLSAKSSNNKVKVALKNNYLTINIPAKFKGDATITISSTGNANVNGANKSFKISIVNTGKIACPVRNADETNHRGLNGTSWGYKQDGTTRGNRYYHIGIDLIAKDDKYSNRKVDPKKDGVYALTDGIVEAVGEHSINGKYVIISHVISNKKVYSCYGHLNSYSVKKGQSVNSDTRIGYIGWTGSSEGNGKHLHLGITDKLYKKGQFYGYTSTDVKAKKLNKTKFEGAWYYNPWYVINNNKLP